jgi:hypothetical protein
MVIKIIYYFRLIVISHLKDSEETGVRGVEMVEKYLIEGLLKSYGGIHLPRWMEFSLCRFPLRGMSSLYEIKSTSVGNLIVLKSCSLLSFPSFSW